MISIALILSSIGCLALAVLVLLRGKNSINLLFAGICLCFAVWSITILRFLNTESVSAAFIYAKLYYLAAATFALLLLLFAMVFPEGKKLRKKTVYVIIAGSAVTMLPLILFRGYITESISISAGNNLVYVDKPSYILFSAYFLLYFYIAITIAIKKYIRGDDHEKVQVGAYAFGILLNSIPGVMTNLILPYYGNYRYIWIGPLCSIFFLGLTSYGIIRYKLFDIRFYVVRALAYSMSVLVLSFLYIAPLMYVVTWSVGIRLTPVSFWVGLIAATVVAYYYQSLRNQFDQLSARLFFRHDYNPEQFIAQLNRAVVTNLDLRSMLTKASDIIATNYNAEYCYFMLDDDAPGSMRFFGQSGCGIKQDDALQIRKHIDKTPDRLLITDYVADTDGKLKALLRRNNIAVIGRLSNTNPEGTTGSYLVLGPKKGGNMYNARDTLILETISDGLVVAILNALRFEEIQNFNITLQRRIDDATAQLRRTNAKLKLLDETKDDFISMASHQLRTPLTSVKGYLSMVLDGDAGKVTPLQRQMLDQAYVSSQRMVFLIADLLNVSRLKTGKFVIEPSRVDLSEIVAEEVHQLTETAKNRSLTLQYDRPAAFPELMLDETKIRQVIMNFIDNAIYYTPTGGKIEVELVETPVSVKLFVRDNGIGVPRIEQPHLFTKFYRAGNARRARPDGTGLGLFMAKKVIVAQGGTLVFDSKEGRGSTFGFIFAKNKLAVPAPSKPKSKSTAVA